MKNTNKGLKLAPDFATTPHLYPVTGGQKNIVRIKLAGGRSQDFALANSKSNIPVLNGKDAPEGFTWHHLDDFDPKTGECTMQLVKSEVHRSTLPHTGSVNQYVKYFGIEKYNP